MNSKANTLVSQHHHASHADTMTAWCTPAGQLPLDVAARKKNRRLCPVCQDGACETKSEECGK